MDNHIQSGNGDLVLETSGTASDSLVHPRVAPPTAAHSVNVPESSLHDQLTIHAADLRDKVHLLSTDVTDVHQLAQSYDLQQRAQIKAHKSVRSLLEELSVDRGMPWTNIARMVGVSVGAVRKWRKDGSATGENRLALGHLAAFLDLLEQFAVEDPAGWLEVPLLSGYTVTALDLYRNRMEVSLLDYAGQRLTVAQLLDKYDPGWRDKYRTGFEVFQAADGDLAIRRR